MMKGKKVRGFAAGLITGLLLLGILAGCGNAAGKNEATDMENGAEASDGENGTEAAEEESGSGAPGGTNGSEDGPDIGSDKGTGGALSGENAGKDIGDVQESGESQESVDGQEANGMPAEEVPAGGAEAGETPFAGKTLSICGDSISTFTGYIPDYYSKFYPEFGEITEVEDTWWMQVLERTGMELRCNASYSGSTVSGQSQDNGDGKYACGNCRVLDLAGPEWEDPDVILILMGTNDLLTDIPLGAYDGVSAVEEGYIQTFSEAYALMLDKMLIRYPDTQIYCCTILEVGRWDEEGNSFAYRNAHSATAQDYNAWIKTVAAAKGLPVIDVYDCGITAENIKDYTSDGTHPNVAGAKRIADKICAELGCT